MDEVGIRLAILIGLAAWLVVVGVLAWAQCYREEPCGCPRLRLSRQSRRGFIVKTFHKAGCLASMTAEGETSWLTR